jgi:hypothetical protein
MTITQRQYLIMVALHKGSRVQTHEDGSFLIDPSGKSMLLRGDSLRNLKTKYWIREQKNDPVPGVNTWVITRQGKNWVESHWASPLTLKQGEGKV